jgi:hypothetical protein
MQVDYGYSSRARRAEDRLERMFALREKFMEAIRDKRGAYGEWPIDLGDKKSQQLIREITLKGVEEMFEALGELKNWKSHRLTENREVNREAFLEEIVDAFNYFFAVLILAGVNADELFTAYEKKDAVIHDRLNNGY